MGSKLYKKVKKCVEERPWGKFEKYVCEKAVIKIIEINPNSELSLQYHNLRDEFWKVIQGSGKVTLEDKIMDVKEGDEIFIPRKTIHKAIALENTLKLIEISLGDFDENDIVRIKDKYGREINYVSNPI